MKLGLSLGLEDNATALTWEPSDEASCLGWYKYGTGFTLVSPDGTMNGNGDTYIFYAHA